MCGILSKSVIAPLLNVSIFSRGMIGAWDLLDRNKNADNRVWKISKKSRQLWKLTTELHNIVHFWFSIVFYWLHFVQNCKFCSTLGNIPTKIGDSQQKTCFLLNAQLSWSVYCPKLSVFLPWSVTHLAAKIIWRLI